MADEKQQQQPESSQVKEEPKTVAPSTEVGNSEPTASTSAGNAKTEEGQQSKPAGKGRKRKLSANARKNNAQDEEDAEDKKLKFLLEPVLDALREIPNGNEAETLKLLISTLQPSQNEIDVALIKVKMDLSRVLGFSNNSFVVYDFGSIKSGLAFRDSDLDFYVHYDNNSESKPEQTKLIHIIHGRMSRERTFHSFLKILGARVPLLRVVHGPTNLTCDINFSNARGCYNSKFIYAVTRFDPRIHKLAVIIKFWAKCAYLLTNHRQMNTYCIIMMLIFYLQTKKLPLLPSVQDLQKGIPRVNYGPWNLGYPRDIAFAQINTESVRNLLTTFFKYYSNFNFQSLLISPYVGRLCSVEEMKNQKVRELQAYYRAVQQDFSPFNFNALMSIQDPFELNMNIGGVCNSMAHFEQIKLSFKTAYTACCESHGQPFPKLLEAVFTKTARYTKPAKSANTGPAPVKTSAQDNNGTISTNPPVAARSWRRSRLLPLEYELFVVQQILQKKLDKDTIITARQVKDMWADCMLDFIEDILEKIYLCQITPMKDVERMHTIPNKVRTEDIRTIELSCSRQVMLKRSRLQFDNEQELEREIGISKARWELDRPMVFKTRVDLFKTEDAVEFHVSEEHQKIGAIRVFVENCFMQQLRNCVKGYFKVMLAKAESAAKTN